MKQAGAKRALMLPVSAPFHSVLMQPAAAVMANALAGVDIQLPAVPLVANVRAEGVTEPGAIRRLLVEQVTGTVRWRESIANMAEAGVTEFWEIGAGKALSGMIKRIAKDASVRNVGVPADIAALKG
jgi:[acyl-carrier-protein] S-malonyltransferase